MRVLFVENDDSFSLNVVDALPVDRKDVVLRPGREVARDSRFLDGADVVVVGPGPTDPVRAGIVGVVQAAVLRRVPLVRNDLAQVCRQKTIHVANQRRILKLPYALQAVSDIVGVLDDGKTPLDVLAALHPGGSVTGGPKRAALSMIGRLEPDERGAYCGALGLLTGARSVFSLLIRTATRSAQDWVYGVGSGIVYDSDPQAELEELRVKMGALIASSAG